MNNTFLERLRTNTLTDAAQYRRMQQSLTSSNNTVSAPVKEDWKQWALVPVHAGPYSQAQTDNAPAESDATQVQRAMGKLG